MQKRKISLILLVIFIITLGLTAINVFLPDSSSESAAGTININNTTIHYDKSGKCLEVIDGNTIQVYGVGRVQLSQVKTPNQGEVGFKEAKDFVEKECLGKTVYLDIDNQTPEDRYGRALAIVYTDSIDINKELINKNLAEISYFPPSEFKKGEI
ncbi:thermonuclease family protein [Methanobrevibacter sp.]|uniref:thermonuclease family protein n=1 Tax=Methanobrevibacter sp. TaxID=66852 RepID=UPI00388D2A53